MTVTVDWQGSGSVNGWQVQILAIKGYSTTDEMGQQTIRNDLAESGSVTAAFGGTPSTTSYIFGFRGISTANVTSAAPVTATSPLWTEICDNSMNSGTYGDWGGLQVMFRKGTTSSQINYENINEAGGTTWGSVIGGFEIKMA